MKKRYKKNLILTYKKQLVVIAILLGLLFVADHFFTLLSFIKPHGIAKALALEPIGDVKSMLSVTPTPAELPLFSLNTFVASAASPTPTKPPLVKSELKNDYCLNVPILIYHHVQPLAEAQALGHAQLTVDSDIFDSQMAYLAEQGYHTITSSDVVFALRDHAALPPKSIVVTLDDGYDDAYNYAFQIAKKYNVKMDFMIPSGLVGNPGYLTWDQLKEMSQNPLIGIYNHTWSHAALGDASEETINREVTDANKELEGTLGKKIDVFVYPYGSFGPTVITFLQNHGFVGAISTLPGRIQCESFIMTLHRDHIGNAPLSSYGF